MLTLIILFLISITLISFIQKNKRETSNDPPQPLQLPLIGGLYLIDPKEPHISIHKQALRFGKIFSLWFGRNQCVFINDGELYRDFYIHNHEYFLERPDLLSYNVLFRDRDDLALTDGESWRPRRDLLMSTLSRIRLKTLPATLYPQVDYIIQTLTEYQQSGQPYSPRLLFRKFSTNIVNTIMMSYVIPHDEGLEEGFMGKVVKPVDRFLERAGGNSLFDHIYGVKTLYSTFIKIKGTEVDEIKPELRKFYIEHLNTIDRENPRDFMDAMIISNYTEKTILNICLDFLVAGSETSSTVMEWFLLLMVNNPEVADKAFNELNQVIGRGNKVTLAHKQSTPYFQAVMKEVLRYKTITPLGPLFREAKDDITIQDYFIKKGTIIIPSIYSIHNNESVYKDPRVFDPDRFLIHGSFYSNHWTPFAIGPRNCIGMNIALDELYLVCASILLNFNIKAHNPSLPPPSPSNNNNIDKYPILDETEVFGSVAKPLVHLYRFYSR